MGFVIKVHAVYETPFWCADDLSGTAFSPYELVHEAYDNTNFGDPRGTLVGFVSNEEADAVLALTAVERVGYTAPVLVGPASAAASGSHALSCALPSPRCEFRVVARGQS